MRSRLLAASAAVLLLTVAACGGDDDGGDDAAPTDAADETTTSAGEAEPEVEASCAGTDITYENLSTGETVDVVSTGAFSLSNGSAYTVYLADYELTEDDFSITGAEVPDGSNLITLALTIFNSETTPELLEPGTEVTYTEEFGELTFVVTQQQGTTAFGTNTGAEGTLTITAVGDTFCAEVDYADDEKTLSGTVEAEVIRAL